METFREEEEIPLITCPFSLLRAVKAQKTGIIEKWSSALTSES